jgi:hypothetical protein
MGSLPSNAVFLKKKEAKNFGSAVADSPAAYASVRSFFGFFQKRTPLLT